MKFLVIIISAAILFLATWVPVASSLPSKSSKISRQAGKGAKDVSSFDSKTKIGSKKRAFSNGKKKGKSEGKKQLFDVVRNKFTGLKRKSYKYYLEVMASGSSEFECACIKATRPNNDPPKEKYVSSIVAAVNNFDDVILDYSQSNDDSDPYEIALHKIWFRIANKQDWRIKLKALYVLHRIWSSVQVETASILKKRMGILSKNTCKKTGKRYFCGKEAVLTSSCLSDHSHFAFLQMYSKYVLFRCRTFSPSFEEAIIGFSSESSPARNRNDMKDSMKRKQLKEVLEKMKQALSIILSYSITASAVDEITASCYSLLRQDLDQLYYLYGERLSDFIDLNILSNKSPMSMEKITTPQISSIVSHTKKVDKATRESNDLVSYYVEINERIQKWSAHHSKIFRDYDNSPSVIDLERCLSINKAVDYMNAI